MSTTGLCLQTCGNHCGHTLGCRLACSKATDHSTPVDWYEHCTSGLDIRLAGMCTTKAVIWLAQSTCNDHRAGKSNRSYEISAHAFASHCLETSSCAVPRSTLEDAQQEEAHRATAASGSCCKAVGCWWASVLAV